MINFSFEHHIYCTVNPLSLITFSVNKLHLIDIPITKGVIYYEKKSTNLIGRDDTLR